MRRSTTEPRRPERWASRLGVILAVAGSAVGLGNFLRFPGQVMQNGGGAFMVPYFVALVLLGVPLMLVEWTMGRHGGRHGLHSTPAILGCVARSPLARDLGVLGLLVPFAIYAYYVVIEAWCLRYAVAYAAGAVDLGGAAERWPAEAAALFARVSGSAAHGAVFARPDAALLAWIATCAANVWVLGRGLSGGIERTCRVALPVMVVCALVVLGRVLTLPAVVSPDGTRTVADGLAFMWRPDLARLADFRVWLAAAAQVFFTLSVGFGIIVNYASYVGPDEDVVASGLAATGANEFFEVGLGGMITVPAAFVFLGATGIATSTFGLGFETLPVVFAHMGGVGAVVGAVWFAMLFLAALTSSLSMLQPVVAWIVETFAWDRPRAVRAVAAASVLASAWVLWGSERLVVLDTLDFWVGSVGIFLLGTLELVAFGWWFGATRGLAEARRGASLPIPRAFAVVVRWVAPLYLGIVFVGFVMQGLADALAQVQTRPIAALTLVGVVALLVAFVVATRRAAPGLSQDRQENLWIDDDEGGVR